MCVYMCIYILVGCKYSTLHCSIWCTLLSLSLIMPSTCITKQNMVAIIVSMMLIPNKG